MIEIERKFLVNSNAFKAEAFNSYNIKQGFLNSHKERTVRIRVAGNKGYLTIKGKSKTNGFSRFEWEKEVPIKEAEALLKLCEPGIIDKRRYEVKYGKHVFEVDEFFGDNGGLVIAEVELKSEEETYEKPKWLGKEVTGDIKYYNSQLSKMPYGRWV
jgi:CYTH domain-containing protein